MKVKTKDGVRTLANGMDYGYGDDGSRHCRGAKMGRRDTLPEDLNVPVNLHFVRLPWVDGDYDPGGAYWGRGLGNENIYWAFGLGEFHGVEIFVRAPNHTVAKEAVRQKLPNATFFC